MKQFLHIIYCFLLVVLMTTALSGCGADKNLKKGEKYLAIGEYYDAATQFKQAYSKTAPKEKSKRGDIALKIAHCNERINATQKASAAYANAVRYGREGGKIEVTVTRVGDNAEIKVARPQAAHRQAAPFYRPAC